jgi:exonuclease V gamma subunit
MQVTLPDDLSVRLHKLAAQCRQPFEQFLADHLRLTLDDRLAQLPLAEQAELQALRHLSNDALWTIALEQMAVQVQARMTQLLELHSLGKLSTGEEQELAMLIERGDQLMLRKAEAVKLLYQRGYTVSAQGFAPPYA